MFWSSPGNFLFSEIYANGAYESWVESVFGISVQKNLSFPLQSFQVPETLSNSHNPSFVVNSEASQYQY